MRRVADMLVTAHSTLRDRLDRRALLLELCILIGSLVVTVLALSCQYVTEPLLQGEIRPELAIGLGGLILFALSIVGIKVDWARRAALHDEAARAYASLKLKASDILATPATQKQARFDVLQAEYSFTAERSIAVPERAFLRLKKKHLQKVAVSRLLDQKPGVSPLLARMRLWWRDNV